MRLLIAPDSFSDFDSAPGIVARARRVLEPLGVVCTGLPMADGGEGTTLVLMNQLRVQTSGHRVSGPLGEAVHVPVLSLDGGHFVESARAVGRSLLRDGPSDPWRASSYGLGEVLSAMDLDHEEGPLLVGLGGSACFDAGLGLAQALGLHLIDHDGNRLPLNSGADALERVARIEGDSPLEDRLVCAWYDTQVGLQDAVSLFGPEKGFERAHQDSLLRGLENWVSVVNQWREQQHLDPTEPGQAGAGAAGGLGFALKALLDAPLLPGAAAIGQRLRLRDHLLACDAVLTGEGRIDASSFQGKVIGCITTMARQYNKPVLALTGSVRGPLPLAPVGPDVVFSCEGSDHPDREKAFDATLKGVADHLLDG